MGLLKIRCISCINIIHFSRAAAVIVLRLPACAGRMEKYALAYYNLTTYKPWEISVAINRKSRVKVPDYPPVKLYYFSPGNFNAGIEKMKFGRNEVKIYCKEKTICDCMRYRKQLGKDINQTLAPVIKLAACLGILVPGQFYPISLPLNAEFLPHVNH